MSLESLRRIISNSGEIGGVPVGRKSNVSEIPEHYLYAVIIWKKRDRIRVSPGSCRVRFSSPAFGNHDRLGQAQVQS